MNVLGILTTISCFGKTVLRMQHQTFVSKLNKVAASWLCFCLFLCFGFQNEASAQLESTNWFFGNGAGHNFSGTVPVNVPGGMINSSEGVTSISDASGNLLFYSDGVTVFDRNHAVMPNGSGLFGGTSSSQSAIAVKLPGSTSVYYLFTAAQDVDPAGICYTVIDMSLNGGFGDAVVAQKNIPLLAPATEKLSAVLHCNKVDNWIVAHAWGSNEFYAWQLTPTGLITTPVISPVGSVHNSSALGCMKASPDGTRLALAVYNQGAQHYIELFDFNSTTGQISNPSVKNLPGGAYGVEFSPNSRYLYYTAATAQNSNGTEIWQMDMCAGSPAQIINSAVLINSVGNVFIRSLQNASDGKLYFSLNTRNWIGVIPLPNLAAPSCGFLPNGSFLNGGICYAGLPNFNASFFFTIPKFQLDIVCKTASFSAQELIDNYSCSNTLLSYWWSFGEPSSGASNSSNLVDPTHTYAANGTYLAKFFLEFACGIDSVELPVDINCSFQVSLMRDSLCLGECSLLNASIVGGVPPFQYTWTHDASINASQANVCPNTTTTYGVTVTDANGTQANATAIIVVSTNVLVQLSGNQLQCAGNPEGVLNSIVSSGTSPYTYSWSNGDTQANLTGLYAGTYTLVVSDAAGCSDSDSYTFIEPTGLQVSGTITDPNCGSSNGSIAVLVNGGTGPFSYDWSDGATGPIRSNLGAGTYDCTVTDANGCDRGYTAVLVNSGAPVIQVVSSNDVTCFGFSDGQANLSVSGGSNPLQLSWPDGSNSLSRNDLVAGTYIVDLIDGLGCTAQASIVIAEPQALSANLTIQDETCAGSDGSASVSITGGTPTYVSTWMNNSSTTQINNLAPGNVSVLVVDAEGCQVTATGTIAAAPSYNGSIQIIQGVSCNGGSDGSIEVITNYPQVLWWDGSSNLQRSGLSAGTYQVTLSGLAGCSSVISYQLLEPNPIQGTISLTPATCLSGGASASAAVSGGSGALDLVWSTGSISSTVTGLPSSSAISLTITDANGCSLTLNDITPSSPVLSIDALTVNSPSCPGALDGSCSATISGNSGTVSYSWSTGGTSNSISNLGAGAGSLTVTDQAGCIATQSYLLTDPLPIQIQVSTTANSCFGFADAQAQVSSSDGQAPYLVTWPDGSNLTSRTDLAAGVYLVNVSDASGCNAQTTVQIVGPDELLANFTTTDASCGASSGSASISVTGGTLPYFYLWDTGESTSAVNNLAPGSISVLVSDASGCQRSFSSSILAVSAPVSSIDILEPISCFAGSNAEIEVNSNASISVVWENGSTSLNRSGLSAGTYTAFISDPGGCLDTLTLTLAEPSQLTASVTTTNATCSSSDGTAEVQASGGTIPYSYTWSNGSSQVTESNLPAGTIDVVVTDANQCALQVQATIGMNSPLTWTQVIHQDATCFGGNEGSALVQVAGNTGGLTYTWLPNVSSTGSATNLISGVYSVIVTDAAGCSLDTFLTISEPSPIQVSVLTQDANCFGEASGSAEVFVSGGTFPYTYQLNGAAVGSQLANLNAGVYQVVINDINNCNTSSSFTVEQPALIDIQIAVQVSTCGLPNGQMEAFVTGGTAPYSYAWNTGSTSSLLQGINAGTYQLEVTDSHGCFGQLSKTFTDPGAPSIMNVQVQDAKCYGESTGQISIGATGGNAPYSVIWSNGETGALVSNLVAGTYSVILTDAVGCIDSLSLTVGQPAELTLSTFSQAVSCFGLSDGAIQAIGLGGTSPYTITAVNESGMAVPNLTQLTSGVYTLSATDVQGCLATAEDSVTEPAPLFVELITSDVTCNGASNGMVTALTQGGTIPYLYAWTSVQGLVDTSSMSAGWYQLSLLDGQGCLIEESFYIDEPEALNLLVYGPSAVCAEQQVNLELFAQNGFGDYAFSWDGGQSFSQQTSFTAVSDTTLIAQVTDENGCLFEVSHQLIVHPLPIVSLSSDSVSLCAGECVDVSINPIQGSTVSWELNSGVQKFGGGVSFCFEEDGKQDLTVHVLDQNGCEATRFLSDFFTIHTLPTADFSVSEQQVGLLDALVQFTNNSSGADSSYWDFDQRIGGEESIEFSPSYQFTDINDYPVSLTVINEFGCENQTVRWIKVSPDFSVYIPSAFSPNADGTNDVFLAQGIGFTSEGFHLEIYNRWGAMVFKSDDRMEGWNGGLQNSHPEHAKSDVYVYTIILTDFSGLVHEYQGQVTLLK